MSSHHQKILIRSIEQRLQHIDMAFENLNKIGTYDRDDFYFDEPEIREKYVQVRESLKEIRNYLNDAVMKLEK
ncbi:hypothetical protein LOH54_09970 [Sulfurimonas sp. HSL-3221]|uniref:hypothetical protein n=1 Tax=Sulfurimonadaceae TaxID=2771471 RepID=UPI001E375B9E|nr:hypothetical protein [Sulfurimonas sp. HSL-3221]UFS61974.1 hypothetical protein LOH54_09970 [Sulfurimonas sp. HSL-3221]